MFNFYKEIVFLYCIFVLYVFELHICMLFHITVSWKNIRGMYRININSLFLDVFKVEKKNGLVDLIHFYNNFSRGKYFIYILIKKDLKHNIKKKYFPFFIIKLNKFIFPSFVKIRLLNSEQKSRVSDHWFSILKLFSS